MNFRLIQPTRVFDHGHLPSLLRKGFTQTTPASVQIVLQNKQNYPDTAMIAAGATHIDENPGTISQIPANQRAGTLRPDYVIAFCQNAAITRNKSGFGITDMTQADCDTVVDQIINDRARPGMTNDGGIGFAASQMGEVPAGQEFRAVNYNTTQGRYIETELGRKQALLGRIYVGGYDGCIRYDALDPNWSSASDLVSDAAVLNWLRVRAAAFDNHAFKPFSAFNKNYRGSALVVTPLIQLYVQGFSKPGFIVASTAFRLAMVRIGLRALANEQDGNGQFYHTTPERAALLAQRVCLFVWNDLAEVGTANTRIRIDAPGGYYQGVSFAIIPKGLMEATNLIGLVEPKCRMIYHWDDTTRFGENKLVAPDIATESGYQVGYFGTAQVTYAHPIVQYEPGTLNVPYPLQSKTGCETLLSALDMIRRAFLWVGESTPWTYGRVQDGSETTLCSRETETTYAWLRGRAEKAIGYECYNQTTGRAAFLYLNYNLPVYGREVAYAEVAGTKVLLQLSPFLPDGTPRQDRRLFGSTPYLFIYDNVVNSVNI